MNEGEKTGFSNGRIFSFPIAKSKRHLFLLVFVIAAVLNITAIAKNTSALYFQGWTSQHIINQAYAQGVYRCYTAKNGGVDGDADPIWVDDYPYAAADATQILQTIPEAGNQFFGYQYLFQMVGAKRATLFPNGLAPAIGANCASLMNDFGLFSDTVYERLGVPREKITFDNKSKRAEIDGFMTGMGYSATTVATSSDKSCYSIKYRADRVSLESTSKAFNGEWIDVIEEAKPESDSGTRVCVTLGEDGKIASASNEGWDGDWGHGNEYFLAYVDGTTVHFQLWAVTDKSYGHEDCSSYGSCIEAIFEDDREEMDGSFDAKGKTITEFEDALKSTVTQIRYTQGIGAGDDQKYNTRAIAPLCHQDGYLSSACDDSFSFKWEGIGIYVSGITKLSDDIAGNTTWNLTGDGNDALKFIYNNSIWSSTVDKQKAGSSWSKVKITESEKALLYQWYMANPDIGRTNVVCDPTEEELKTHPDWKHKVEWFDDETTKKTCYVASYPHDDSVQVVLLDEEGYFDHVGSIYDLMDGMKYSISTLSNVDPNDIIASGEAQAAFEDFLLPSGTPKEDCFSGAGSMGWIICPIIFDLGKLVRDKYVDWVEPALQVNTRLFGSDDQSPAYMAWNVFRNIANLAFIILFIVVIISQTTGIGIDNYGIKKILPKLIIGAILINCSYIICQLAIDIANIIGYGIAGVFEWISNQINSGIPKTIKVEGAVIDPGKEGLLGDGFAGMGAIVVVIVGVISAASVLSQGSALVVPILMAILGVSFSFFTLIMILGMRQAASVLLVAASPLAFVCYMLPNTKKIFDKWFKALQGLLIAFPACSALIYGGDMVGRILLSTSYGSTWILISAAVVSIAPIFLVPKLIRSSMGAVSNAMTNASRRLSHAARDAGNNSRLAKDIRAGHEWRQQRRINLRRAGLNSDYEETERGRRRRERAKKGGYAQMNMARARAAVLRDYSETAQSERMAGQSGIELLNNQMYGIDEKNENAAIASVESQAKLGQLTITEKDENGKDKEVKVDPRSIEQLKKALVQAILKGEDEKQKALTNILSSKGDEGREAVHDAIGETEDAAQHMSSSEISQLRAMHKSLASHIMDNFSGDYKNNNRSTYDWAARSQTNSQSFDNEFLGGKREWMAKNSINGKNMAVKNVKGTSLLNMDNQEFRRLADSHATMSPSEKADLTKAITVALNSQAASGADIKRIEELKNLMNNLGKS